MARNKSFFTLVLVIAMPALWAGCAGGSDSSTDAGTDAGTDSGTDSGTDLGNDPGTDTVLDAGDAGTDMGAEKPAPAPPTVMTSIDTYSLEVTITVVAEGPVVAQSIQRSVDGGPWQDVGEDLADTTAVFTDSPARGAEVAYRGRTTSQSGPVVKTSLWSAMSSETIVPLQGLPVVRAIDVEPDGDLDNDDLEAALATCYELGGCNLVLEEGTYADVEIKIGEFNDYNPATESVYEELAGGFTLVGQGTGQSILKGKVYPTNENSRATILLDAVPFDGWVFQGFTLQGRKQDQPAPDPGVYLGNNVGLLTAPPPGYNLPGYNSVPFIPNHNGIPGYEKHNLLIHNLEIRDYLGSGIAALAVINPQVLDNVIENMGCHHACENHRREDGAWVCDEPFVGLPEQDPETLCGSNLGQAQLDAWNDSFPTSTVPGTKVPAFGIGFFGGIVGGLISGNVIKYATKHGIELYGPQIACATDGVTVQDNEVHHSTTGFTNNGGCNSTFSGNLAHSSGLPGQDYTAALGRGFICGGRGENNQWLDNISRFNNSAGYSLACWGEDDDEDGTYVANVVLDGNLSVANCLGLGVGQGAADLAMASSASSHGFTITNHTIENASQCEAGMYVIYIHDITIDTLTLDASRHSSVPAGSEIFNRVVWLDRITNSTFDIDLHIGDYNIAQGGYYDFNSQILSNISVTLDEMSSAGGSLLKDYTTVSGTATGQNVSHNGVLLP